MSSSLFLVAPLHLPQHSLLRSRSISFCSRSFAPPSRIAVVRSRSSTPPSPAVRSRSSDPSRNAAAAPVFSSPSSCDSFSPVSSAPQTPAAAAESDVKGRVLLRQRMIFLAGRVDDSVAFAISRQLILLDDQDHTKDIHLFISSRGGLLRAAQYILRTIQSLRADVSIIAIGFVASPISIILCGGAKGKRLSTPRTTLLLGLISDGGVADAAKKIISIVRKKNQHYITAADAVKRGIIDAVFEEL